MAIPQINQITSVLRDMPDAQLQQYAAMHKSDPYVLSLAVAESNARKQLRASQQAKMAGQKPPTVVEQDLMGMAPQPQLPEQQGIGALPAPNMARMADGGIAGYGDGGPTEQDPNSALAYSNEPVMRMAEGGIARYKDEGLVQGGVLGDLPGYVQGNPFMPQPGDGSDETTLQKIQKYLQNRRAEREKFQAEKTGKPTKAEQELSAFDKASEAYMTERDAKKAATAGEKKDAVARADTGDVSADTGATEKPYVPPARPGLANPVPGFVQYAEQFKPAAIEDQATYLAKRKEALGVDPTEKQMARVEKEEAGAAGEKDTALKMAMLKAGLGMMAGKSQYALQNIGEGAMGGVADYNEAMKDLKKAARERDKMRADIENAQYAYKRGDVDAYEKHQESAKNREAQWQHAAMQGIASLTGSHEQAQAHIAAAGMPGAQQQLLMALGKGDVAKGLEKMTSIQAGKLNMSQLYGDYLKSTAGKDTTLNPPLTAQQFAQQMQQIAMFANVPKATGNATGKVLD